MLAVISRSILSRGLLSTRKWYIMKFLFLVLLFKKKKFVKILLSMTFISISISLKTSNILENKLQVSEKSD